MTAFVKTGGSFRLGVINPETGYVDSFSDPKENAILSVGGEKLYSGLPSYLPIQLGTSAIPTDQVSHTGVVEPIAIEINSIETSDTPQFAEMPFDPEPIIVFTGKTLFRVELLESADVREIAIENFCRAVWDEPLRFEEGSEVVIEYVFSLYLTYNRVASPVFNGIFLDPETQEPITLRAETEFVLLDPTAPYPWTQLMSGWTKAFTLPNAALAEEADAPRRAPDLFDQQVVNIQQETWLTINGTELPEQQVDYVYLGNDHFGIALRFVDDSNRAYRPLPIPPQKRLSLLLTIDWSK